MRVAAFLALTSVLGTTSGTVLSLHRRAVDHRAQRSPLPITATRNSYWFDVEVEIGNKTFYLVVDTGSSDTWVAATGYTCIDPTNNKVLSEDKCIWSPTYDESPSTHYVKNQTFGVKYGTGIALGKLATEKVKIGGITVPEQKIGIVDRTNDKGDGINSGILGLGFPALTSAHPGTVAKNDSLSLITNRAIYDPLFVTMYKSGLVDSWYSIALDRLPRDTPTGKAGWLSFGALPQVKHSDDWAKAPIEVTKAIPEAFYQGDKPEITLMTLTVDSISWGSSSHATTTNTTKFQAVVDTGNPMNLVPIEAARSINALFEPPAKFNKDLGIFLVACDAKAPSFGVTIDGHKFWHQPEDMIARDNSTGACYSTLSGEAEGLGVEVNFLGDAFLKNVVSVFDFGKKEMRFAARTENAKGSSSPSPTPSSHSSAGVAVTAKGLALLPLSLLLTALF